MRLNLTKSQVKTIGIKPLMKVDYTAKQNNTVFTILTKSLYLRPINAIVRELCTNCLDAHIAVNKQDQPFDVTLPTKLDPYFIVRDYGCSMDIDQVVKVYSVLGNSSKNSESNSIGGWGIGGKSPFAITEVYFITTYLDGIRRTFRSSIQKNENPLELLQEGPTDEPNGVMVKVPVSENNIQKFVNAFEEELSAFDVKPNVFGRDNIRYRYTLENPKTFLNVKIDLPTQDNELELSEISLPLYSANIHYQSSFAIRMGCVLYPLSLDSDHGEKWKEELSAIQSLSGIYQFVVDVPVDAVDIKPDRENLEYSERTNHVVSLLLSKILKHYKKEILTFVWANRKNSYSVITDNLNNTKFGNTTKDYIKRNYTFFWSALEKRTSLVHFIPIWRSKLNSTLDTVSNLFNVSVCYPSKEKTFKFNYEKHIASPNKTCTIYVKQPQMRHKLGYFLNHGEISYDSAFSTYASHRSNGFLVIDSENVQKLKSKLQKYYDEIVVVDLPKLPKEQEEKIQQKVKASQPRTWFDVAYCNSDNTSVVHTTEIGKTTLAFFSTLSEDPNYTTYFVDVTYKRTFTYMLEYLVFLKANFLLKSNIRFVFVSSSAYYKIKESKRYSFLLGSDFANKTQKSKKLYKLHLRAAQISVFESSLYFNYTDYYKTIYKLVNDSTLEYLYKNVFNFLRNYSDFLIEHEEDKNISMLPFCDYFIPKVPRSELSYVKHVARTLAKKLAKIERLLQNPKYLGIKLSRNTLSRLQRLFILIHKANKYDKINTQPSRKA
ncbi:MAG: putative protein rIIA [Prokaryotic dsDNA virus sp.]|nr:MAG: putative protein rIIA [Prokaryotic dsDNA virus sp.]|tara:strand:+ start:351 stop:2666 length:2316 start_codon:yes stop_codon:yes gene_type:complete